jgi:hypothetical protein
MSNPKPRRRWLSRAVGWALFLIVGIPWSALFLLGERECDMHIGPPCAVSWGMMKLLNFIIVIAICWVIGWGINRTAERPSHPDDESS